MFFSLPLTLQSLPHPMWDPFKYENQNVFQDEWFQPFQNPDPSVDCFSFDYEIYYRNGFISLQVKPKLLYFIVIIILKIILTRF